LKENIKIPGKEQTLTSDRLEGRAGPTPGRRQGGRLKLPKRRRVRRRMNGCGVAGCREKKRRQRGEGERLHQERTEKKREPVSGLHFGHRRRC